MREYLEIVKSVLDFGDWQENRTGIRTKAIPNIHFSHNFGEMKQLPASSMWINWNYPQDNNPSEEELLRYEESLKLHKSRQPFIIEDFPLLTTKRVAFKTMAVELEGFINGITDKKWYQERKCHIWDEWANPTQVDQMIPFEETGGNPPLKPLDRKELQKRCNDLGPIYGYQWRKFGQEYPSLDKMANGVPLGTDQLKFIVDTLKENPDDRRLVCSAWNPNQKHLQALPPCHIEFVVTAIAGKISLHWTQRSCDLMLGVPFNIASYGLLLCLLATGSGLQPYNLSGMLCNCHIYENQIEAAQEQISRIPHKLPSLKIMEKDIFQWTHQDVNLIGYNPHSKINFGEVAV